MSGESPPGSVTGETLLEAKFDRGIIPYTRWVVSGFLVITVAGILLIPFWLLASAWYGREYMRRLSARLTTQALEIRKGVFFRSESTIPLNRVTDLRMHDGPLMRHYNLRGVKVETAGQSGATGSEGSLVGVIDADEFRDAVLRQTTEGAGRGAGLGLCPRPPAATSPTSWSRYGTSSSASSRRASLRPRRSDREYGQHREEAGRARRAAPGRPPSRTCATATACSGARAPAGPPGSSSRRRPPTPWPRSISPASPRPSSAPACSTGRTCKASPTPCPTPPSSSLESAAALPSTRPSTSP